MYRRKPLDLQRSNLNIKATKINQESRSPELPAVRPPVEYNLADGVIYDCCRKGRDHKACGQQGAGNPAGMGGSVEKSGFHRNGADQRVRIDRSMPRLSSAVSRC